MDLAMMRQYQLNSYLFGGNAPYVEALYESYLADPTAVPDNWRSYFDALQSVPAVDGSDRPDVAHAPVVEAFAEMAKKPVRRSSSLPDADLGRKKVAVTQLTAAYRVLGCRVAALDPLRRQDAGDVADLSPFFYGLSEADLSARFNVANTFFGVETATLRELIDALRDTYCRTIGAEFMYVSDPDEKRWLQERLESVRARGAYSHDTKKRILERLTAAEGIEHYLHVKFTGQKRFSLQGGESFLVSLNDAIEYAGGAGIKEIVIGMAHRGRLNVLVNTMGKAPAELFSEFAGHHALDLPAGDVKYHQGFSSDVVTPGGSVHLTLAFNPSHLEIVNPVVEGSAKARMDRRGDRDGKEVLPILVHGDAAFAGQGVVMETLNLAKTRGYSTGGTLHIVINNQIGFTTSDPRDARSTLYCSDVVKMIEAPVLHVNADDPEAVVFATRLALDYRLRFRKDIVVDIICYRKLGHNEQDTPQLTQPLMYKRIGQHAGTRKLYADQLAREGVIAVGEGEAFVNSYRDGLDAGESKVAPAMTEARRQYATDWVPFLNQPYTDTAITGLPRAQLEQLAARITFIPEGFKVHSLVEKVLADRAAMGRGELNLDWGMGEHLAYASLLAAGVPVRLTGQDAGRGTFTHRHAVLHDQNREKWDAGTHIPLQHVSDNQAPFTVIDSVLSEEAVLGFEYGYASTQPHGLTLWEAQFGDFVNGAQVVIDQFISSAEVKWGRSCGLVMLLPHGYEGQGPEHSSARPERFLQLCADENMEVAQPTTAAQIFHLLRRQMLRSIRKPLVVLTPKSLLRNKEASSPLTDLTVGNFKTVIGEVDESIDAKKVSRVLVCSGRVYYDLVKERSRRGISDVAILRVEQLYPFPEQALRAECEKYAKAKAIVWVQDEPKNQGAWLFVQDHLRAICRTKQGVGYAGRAACASPAAGYQDKHASQLQALLGAAFDRD
jgi:2-oxoglutarate dehydrogenase E1 component